MRDHIGVKAKLAQRLKCSSLCAIKIYDSMGGDRAQRVLACLDAMEGIEDPAAARALLDDKQMEFATDMRIVVQRLSRKYCERESVKTGHREYKPTLGCGCDVCEARRVMLKVEAFK